MAHTTTDLDAITIASPCTVPWDSMSGSERKRFCGQCRLHVHDISQLTKPEALRLLEKTGGDCCLRIWRRPDGTVVTKDCGRVRLAIQRRLVWLRAAAAGVLSVFGLGGCRSERVAPASYGSGGVVTTGVTAPSPAPRPGPTMGTPPTLPPPPASGKPTMGTPADPTPPRPDGAVPTMGR